MSRAALVVVDVQNDFCPGGALEVPEGDEIIPKINQLMEDNIQVGGELFVKTVATADWHPPGHISFASSHPGHQVHQRIEIDGLEQNLWPDHCVMGTRGAEFHPSIDTDRFDLILRKGTAPDLDSYSAFFENDGKTPTGLEGYLHMFHVERVFIVGLAFDWCVYFSAVDAHRLGFHAFVIEDLCRAVDVPEGFADQRRQDLYQRGVELISTEEMRIRGTD